VGGFPLKRAALSSPRDWRQCSKSHWHPSIGGKLLPAADATSSRPAPIDPVSESIVPMTEPIARRRFLSHIGSLPLLGTSLIWAMRPLGGGDRMRIDLPELDQALSQYLRFVRKHESLWLHGTPISDVAVLRSFPSGAFDPKDSWQRAAVAEEILIRGGFSWGAAFAEKLDVLKQSSALILAGQTYLAPDTCTAIQSFAAAGGGIVILGDVAHWDENGMLYEPSPLADLEGPRVVRLSVDTPRNDSRAGSAVCIALPKQWRSVAEAIERVAKRGLTARLYGSTYVAMSAFQTRDNRLAVHLVNYASPRLPARFAWNSAPLGTTVPPPVS